MFTGIVTELGRIAEIESADSGRRIVIEGRVTSDGLSVGDSVAVNGVCLTAVSIDGETFTVDAVTETLERSNLGALAAGVRVDLERPVASVGRFDGSVVQGHVDGVGRVVQAVHAQEGGELWVQLPQDLLKYCVLKGSITWDGISLTIAAIDGDRVMSAIIPHTAQVTTVGGMVPGQEIHGT